MSASCNTINSKLTGLSLGERHRSLNRLIKEASPDLISPEAVRGWPNSSQANQIYIARLADHFRNAELLCELLRSENKMVVSVATHATWFFRGLTDREFCNADYFITHIFPYASSHSICRMVSALSANLKDETVAEEFYAKISLDYRRNMAIRLLPVCSVSFVRTLIVENSLIIPSPQLIYIYKKDHQVVLEYLQKLFKNEGSDRLPKSHIKIPDYHKVWPLIAQDQPNVYLDLFDKYPHKTTVKFGARITKSLMNIIGDRIIEEPLKYLPILHELTILSKLKGQNLEKYLTNIFTTKNHDFNSLTSYFKHIKVPLKSALFIKIYSMAYNGASALDHSYFKETGMLEYVPAEVRIKWSLEQIESSEFDEEYGEDFYLQFISTDKAIPRLKEISYSTPSVDGRSGLLERMVSCCKINNDTKALLGVLKYVAKRHRNDNETLRSHFLETVNNEFQLYRLSSEHWEVLNEMIDFMCFSKEISNSYNVELFKNIMEQYIHFCLLNNRDIEPIIDRLITYNIQNINLLDGVSQFEFAIQDIFFKKYKDILDTESKTEDEVVLIILKLLNSIYTKNDKNKCSIAKYIWLIDLIKKIEMNSKRFERLTHILYLNQDTRHIFASEIFQNKCSSVTNFSYEKEIVTLKKNYSNMVKSSPIYRTNTYKVNYRREILKYTLQENIIKYCFKHRMNILTDNIDIFLKYSSQPCRLRYYARIYSQIRAYLMNPLGKILLRKVNSDGTKSKTKNAIQFLVTSLLSDANVNEELIKSLAPKEGTARLELHSEERAVAKILGNNIRYINPPVSFDTLLQFTKGDYFKFLLHSLLHLSFNKGSKDVNNFICLLSETRVTVKKHAVRLAFFLYPSSELLKFYKNMWDIEKNTSIRKVLFQRVFKLMETERDEKKVNEIWQIVKYFLSSFTYKDKDLFIHLTQVEKIFPHLIADYSQISWDVLKMLSKTVQVSDEKYQFTKSLIDNLELLNREFCEMLFAEYLQLIGDESAITKNLFIFSIDLILKLKDIETQIKYDKMICDKLQIFILNNWNVKIDNNFKYRTTLKDFVTECCRQSLKTRYEINPINFLKNILGMISSTLPVSSIFNLFIILNLTINYQEVLMKPTFLDIEQSIDVLSPLSNQFMKEFGQKVAKYFNLLYDHYSTGIFSVFKETYNIFITYLFPNYNKVRNISELFVVSGIMEGKVAKHCLILAIDIFPSCMPQESAYIDLYNSLTTRIISEGDFTVKLFLDNKFEQLDDIFKD